MSTGMPVSGSGTVATLPFSAAFGVSPGVTQQLAAAPFPSISWRATRMPLIRATHSSYDQRCKMVGVAVTRLVAAGVALALPVAAPVSPAQAGWFGSETVKVEQGEKSPSREAAKKLAELSKPAKEVVRRKVAGAKDMAENARSTVTDDPPAPPISAETTQAR